ncbi:MAG TPA: hypothetical protein VF371_10820 [Candidatus Limnocylindrales bacterium]
MDFLMRKVTGISGPIKNGVPSDAFIESITDTGTTITSSSVGPEAPVYKLGLQVTPIGGAGAPYPVEVKAAIPRLYIPMVLPGARIGVMVDPLKPTSVSPDFNRISPASAGGGVPGAGGVSMSPAGPGGFAMNFDANGQPSMGDVSALAGGVRSGSVNTIKGSADQLLATGTHGTAIITTAMPLGKTVRDINPAADPSRLNDPVWIFTVEVSLAGEAPFPAVFGHRVPLDKLGAVAPGVKLAVAVNEANRNEEVAIDWEKSPIA